MARTQPHFTVALGNMAIVTLSFWVMFSPERTDTATSRVDSGVMKPLDNVRHSTLTIGRRDPQCLGLNGDSQLNTLILSINYWQRVQVKLEFLVPPPEKGIF